MAWINTDIDIDIDEYLDEVSTEVLKEELKSRGNVVHVAEAPFAEPPSHVVADLKRAFERNDPNEFHFLVRKVEQYLEAVDG